MSPECVCVPVIGRRVGRNLGVLGMLKSVKSILVATTMSAVVLAPAATVATFAMSDAVYAKGGGGGGGSSGGGGGSSSSSKGKSGEKGKSASSSKGGKAYGKGNGLLKRLFGKDKANAAKEQNAARKAARVKKVKKADVVTASAVVASPRPAGRPLKGQSWKTRLESGMLQTHPSELGMWNSAKRNPNAVANLVEKYRMTGKANGAGGMIAMVVVAYEDYNEVAGPAADALQDAVYAGTISYEDAQAIMDGSLTTGSIAGAVDDLNLAAALDEADAPLYVVAYDSEAGTVTCTGDCPDVSDLDGQAGVLNTVVVEAEIDEATGDVITPAMTAGEIAEDLGEAYGPVEEANGLIVPNKTSPGDDNYEDVQAGMIDDVLGLLGLSMDNTLEEPLVHEEVPAEGEDI